MCYGSFDGTSLEQGTGLAEGEESVQMPLPRHRGSTSRSVMHRHPLNGSGDQSTRSSVSARPDGVEQAIVQHDLDGYESENDDISYTTQTFLDDKCDSIHTTPLENNVPVLSETEHEMYSYPVGIDILVYIILLLVIALIILRIALYDNFLMRLVYSVLYPIVLALGCGLVIHALRWFMHVWDRVYDDDSDSLHMNPGILITIVCTSGVYLYNFLRSLPHVVIVMLPDIREKILDNMNRTDFSQREYIENITIFGVSATLSSFIELLLTASLTLMFTMIHHDMKDRFLIRMSPRSVKVVLYMVVVGNVGFWLFKSIMCEYYINTNFIQNSFFGDHHWSIIVHLVNPLAVYYHFQLVLIFLEYILNI